MTFMAAYITRYCLLKLTSVGPFSLHAILPQYRIRDDPQSPRRKSGVPRSEGILQRSRRADPLGQKGARGRLEGAT